MIQFEDLHRKLAELGKEERRLLETLLKEQGIDLERRFIVPRRRTPSGLPLSYGQERLWFLERLYPGSGLYNIVRAVRLFGHLQAEAIAAAAASVVERHESLRTCFRNDDAGVLKQFPSDAAGFRSSMVDLSELDDAKRKQELRARMVAETKHCFDLENGEVFRSTLIRLSDTEHVLLCTFHHIAADGWSGSVFIRDIAAAYEARVSGATSTLEPLPIQYGDYAAWQREWLTGAVFEAQLDYWKQQLSGAPSMPDLPTRGPRPAVQGFAGSSLGVVVDHALLDELQSFSRAEGVTLFMLLLAAFKLLLYRYTGETDIVVGTPVANRGRRETEELIGFFVNTLVLRTDLGGAPTFSALLARVRDVALSAYAHQDLPFEKLVEELNPERDLSRNPLFQIMFALHNFAVPAFDVSGLTIEPISVPTETAQFDLTVDLAETPEGLRIWFEYSTELFDAAMIERLAEHYVRVLRAVVRQPQCGIADVELLDADERRTQLVDWNGPVLAPAVDGCVHEAIARCARRHPDAIAVVDGAHSLSYGALDRYAGQLAARLQAEGVGPERCVGLFMERSQDLLIAMLAVLKAGAAYVPLDPGHPQSRIRTMLADAGIAVVITQSWLCGGIGGGGVSLICMDRDGAEIRASSSTVRHTVEAENLANVIYTSGSEGRPKGVQVSHRSLLGFAEEMATRMALGAGDRVLQFAACGFDVVAEEVFPAWLRGAAVVISGRDDLLGLDELEAVLDRGAVTVCELPALYWQQWVRRLVAAGGSVPGRLRLVLLGCDTPDSATLSEWQRFEVPLMFVFGLTETTVTSMVNAWSGDIDDTSTGRPVANTAVYLLDGRLHTLPVGAKAELYIGGDGVSRGYLHDAAQTAERYVPDPYAASAGRRMYRTGDIGRYRRDGRIEYLGRGDRQVQLRGYRIELGEVEAVLTQCPGVAEAVVTVSDGRLIGYYVAQAAEVDPQDWLRGHLPAYMVPSSLVVLETLPLTANGKLDRGRLPAVVAQRPHTAVAPRDATEAALCDIWCRVLGLQSVGVHDNFFELGGHSLQLLELHAQLSGINGREVTLMELLKFPSIRSLATALSVPEETASAVAKGRQRAARRKALEQKQRSNAAARRRPGRSVESH